MRAILALLLFVCATSPAAAEMAQVGPMQIETLLVCRTLAQAKHFAEMGADKPAIEAITKESGADVCIAIKALFAVEGPVAAVPYRTANFIIVKIKIYGMDGGGKILPLDTPTSWYAIAEARQRV